MALFLVVLRLVACGSQEKVQGKGPSMEKYRKITAQELSRMLKDKDFTLINVHIPYAGEIPQTDLLIPYNEIERYADQLPTDKRAKIVVYCRSGSMSAIAGKTMVDMGYINVSDLDGGMIAWKAAGGMLLDRR